VSAPVRSAAAPRVAEIYRQLQRVIDPEIGQSIVTLGLVYDVAVAGSTVTLTMTLTSRGCPLGAAIAEGVRRAVAELPWVRDVAVNVVWEPAWTPAMIRQHKEVSR
jgi:metal-sulfur cluster biosynthetic enzyme